MPWNRNQRIEWALDHFSKQYKIGWLVPKDGVYDKADDQRSRAAQRILGIPESKIGHYPFEQLFGKNDRGDGGWIWHPSLYWTGPNKIQNWLRLRRHNKALATFRATHGTTANHISANGVKFISNFEGYFGNWYDDGTGVQTIGFGHTGPLPSGFTPTLSRQRALDLLYYDLHSYEAAVKSRITVPLKPNQFDALVSFVYNLGPGPLDDGIAGQINRRDFRGATNSMLQYDHAGGQQLPGLTRRRQAEVALFNS